MSAQIQCEISPRVTKTLTLNFRSLQKSAESTRAGGKGWEGVSQRKSPSFGEGVQRRVKLEPAVLHIVPEAPPKTPGERKIIL